MGDYPIKHARSAIELTDQIFGPATQHEALQDEIYCQIMRQMTNNNNRCSLRVYFKEFRPEQESSYPILHESSPPSLALPHSQAEYGAWVAADVAVFRLVHAQSQFDETHSTLPGVAAKRPAGF